MVVTDNHFVIDQVTVFCERETIENGYIKVANGIITEIGEAKQRIESDGEKVYTFHEKVSLLPGMIDVHIHGVNGADTMDATTEALDTMTKALPHEGTTSFLATTITQESRAIERALQNAGEYIENEQKAGHAEVLGIHLEGPFLNSERAGAQPLHAMQRPDHHVFESWNKLAKEKIKLVTLAPEKEGGMELVRYLSNRGIVASIGHSDATYEQVMEAVSNGATHVTHLYNGMRGMHHREPGVAGAALLFDQLKTEVIADGYHVRPEMIQLAYQQKTSTGMILITDAMRAKCLKNGRYDLGGQEVQVKDGKALLENGTLAGSVLKMKDALKNIQAYAGCSLASAIKMTSENPAKQLGVFDRKGSLAVGKDADLFLRSEEGEVIMTFCKGHLAYSNGRSGKNEID
ncbi:N-acetylglucosamine-6-phosphate deacetylase [Bacillus sp. RAR_GA_16]|uniref:N-acetylglucosamine-6-phosphate deacetylase n=1 Tax=Bacillus sp. RAR_GA_16 TaxID=2876774 RepID=UPI001CCCE048|nr:N-acetylglucosamine-6-phosphate deacetylase [Bacillus sp. RAR_GA_16]MCA0170710.1 N-acetylglucosamine-6-phosphate deacetylase [Bacillus sp. RAR_GA_16]